MFMASACLAFGQTQSGFHITLREDLIDISMPDNANLNPTRTTVSHIFGTELSFGFHEMIGRQWSVGLSAGLMLHDYSWTDRFATQALTTTTTASGRMVSTSADYSGRTTLNLPVMIDVKYRFADWADAQMWDAVPLLSARLGYVVGLTQIDEETYEMESWSNGSYGPYEIEAGVIENRYYGSFNKQGIHFSLGVGLSYRHFDLELEYAMQPSNYVRHHIGTVENLETGESTVKDFGTAKYAFAAGDGLVLRLTYNF